MVIYCLPSNKKVGTLFLEASTVKLRFFSFRQLTLEIFCSWLIMVLTEAFLHLLMIQLCVQEELSTVPIEEKKQLMVLGIPSGKRSATWKFINPVGGIGKNHFKRVYMKRVLKIMQNICTYTIAQQILSSLAVLLLLHVFIGEKMRSFNTHNLKIFMRNFWHLKTLSFGEISLHADYVCVYI